MKVFENVTCIIVEGNMKRNIEITEDGIIKGAKKAFIRGEQLVESTLVIEMEDINNDSKNGNKSVIIGIGGNAVISKGSKVIISNNYIDLNDSKNDSRDVIIGIGGNTVIPEGSKINISNNYVNPSEERSKPLYKLGKSCLIKEVQMFNFHKSLCLPKNFIDNKQFTITVAEGGIVNLENDIYFEELTLCFLGNATINCNNAFADSVIIDEHSDKYTINDLDLIRSDKVKICSGKSIYNLTGNVFSKTSPQ
uniref:Uncharacterized protein n=1 Tax=Pithovirus LCPAC401 TaxID=2506595 RepID=A0A481ZBL8_9VIRU|nr:MAG: hypothetical protein LCPAC401_05030 [Pithovirus LCPAC401]